MKDGIAEIEVLAEIIRLAGTQQPGRPPGTFTRSEFQAECGCSEKAAQNKLRQCILSGTVEPAGRIQGTSILTGEATCVPGYRLTEKARKMLPKGKKR